MGKPSHVGLYSKMKLQKEYKNYVIGGGTLSFDKWKAKQLKINKK